jgi:cytochrome c biogenesis protein CcmG, thiol:disulfide interchange protein DsbE
VRDGGRTRRVWGSLLAFGITAMVVVPLLTGLSGGPGEPVRAALVGRAAPPLTGTTLDGAAFRSEELAGQVVLVNVWASWCGPCRDELPLLTRTERRLALEGLRIVTIDTRDGPAAARALLDDAGAAGLTTVMDPDGRLAVSWGARGVPETFLVDRRGIVRAVSIGPITPQWVRQYVDPLVLAR